MQARTLWTKSSALKIAGIIYTVSGLLALPSPLFGGMVEIFVDQNTGEFVDKQGRKNGTLYHSSRQCMEDVPSDFTTYYSLFRVATLYVIPVIIISVLYSKIAGHLRSTSMNTALSNEKVARDRRKVVRMLAAMVIVFAVCWLPGNVMFILQALPDGRKYMVDDKWFSWYLFVSGVLVYFNCISNPILYTFMSSQYRKGFRRMMCCYQGGRRGAKKSITDTESKDSKSTKTDVIVTSATTQKDGKSQ